MIELMIKPEFHSLIPPISLEEYQLLEKSLMEEGCREPIIVWNDCILDGHNRYEICRKHNIGFKCLEKEFSNEEEAKIWIIRNQLARRNLPPQARARLVLALKPMIMKKAKEQQGSRTDLCQKSDKSPIDTKKELARLADVSHDTIHKVEIIEKEAPEEVKEAVRKGEMSVNKAYRKTRSKNKPKQRTKPAWDKSVTPKFKETFEAFLEIVTKSKKNRWSDNPKSALRDCIIILEGFLT